jgi:hypothetical protein
MDCCDKLEQLNTKKLKESIGSSLIGNGYKPNEYRLGFGNIMEMVYYDPIYKREGIDDYEYSHYYGDEEVGVWIDYENKEIVFAIRGSKTMDDWTVADWEIAKSDDLTKSLAKTDRFKRNRDKILELLKQFPNYTPLFTGHSLGATISTVLYDELRKDIPSLKFVVFNRGTGPKEIFTDEPVEHTRRVHFNTYYDPLSYNFTYDKKTKHIRENPSYKNVHGILNFLT